MRSFTWTPENEVFIGQIDAEHRDLFRVAEGLQKAWSENGPLAEGLRALIIHAEQHFTHEEWLMQSVRYSSYGWHKEQHNAVRRRLKLFAPLIEEGDREATELFLDFLERWLRDHTSLTDRMMAAFVRNYERNHSTSALERWGTTRSAAETVAPGGD